MEQTNDRQTTPVSGAMTPKGFRLDIQGVRGFALVLVLACHAGVPFTEGGFVALDVFYVLSGFLITGLILDEARKTGRVSLLKFYARRARRLLPLAGTVLAVIVAGSLVLFSEVRAYTTSGDVIAAALYVVNWRFMAEAVDYFAFEDPTISPVQHYWSLSVEEQFYLLWPLLILGALLLAARAGWRLRPLLWLLVGALSAASLGYSVWFSNADQLQAYFSTLTRAWEIGLGCALALVLPLGLRMPKLVSSVLTIGGLGALLWTTATFETTIPYPGAYALIPTLGTAAIIVAGTSTVASLPIRVLSTAPFQCLGKISYAYYLWHWPALVFAATIWGDLGWGEKVAVTLAAGVPTIVSHYLIEERFRRSRELARRPRRAVALGVACTAGAVGLGLVLSAAQPSVPVARGSEVQGARALERGEDMQLAATKLTPRLREVEDDRGPMFADDCHLKNDTREESPDCTYGERSSETTAVLFGDSHALQYSPAMLRIARKKGWRLVSLTKGGCTVADVEYRRRCDAWRENSLQRIEREDPDLVVVSNGTGARYQVKRDGEKLDREESQGELARGFARMLRRVQDTTDAEVVVIRDQARAPFDPANCVSNHLDELERCAFEAKRSRDWAFDAKGTRRVPGVELADPLPFLCPKGRCPSVAGNVVVYRNSYHLSATFAETMAPWLARQLPKVE